MKSNLEADSFGSAVDFLCAQWQELAGTKELCRLLHMASMLLPVSAAGPYESDLMFLNGVAWERYWMARA